MLIQGSGQGALLLDNAAAAIDEILAGLGRQRGFHAHIVGTAAAANFAVAEIQNPAASGKTLYVLFGDVWAASAYQVSVVVDGTEFNPVGTPQPAYAGGPNSVAKVGGTNQAVVTGNPFITSPSEPASTVYAMPAWFWCAIPPGHNLQFQNTTANLQLRVNAHWIELSA